MLVSDLMTRGAVIIHPHETLRAAALKLREANVGMLIVVDDFGQPQGVLTDRDIVTRAVALGLDPAGRRVDEAMTPQVVLCTEDDDISHAEDLMEQRAVRRLVVMDNHAQVTGVLSLDDLAMARGEEARVASVLERVHAPAR